MRRPTLRGVARRLAAGTVAMAVAGGGPAAWACAIPTPQVALGAVRGVVQEAGVDPSVPWGPDLPGAILEVEAPAGLLRFRLSRNIGMTLEELRARARDGRAVRVRYETLYDGQLRALEVVGAEGPR